MGDQIKFPEHSINEKPRHQPYKTLLLATVVKEFLLYNQSITQISLFVWEPPDPHEETKIFVGD